MNRTEEYAAEQNRTKQNGIVGNGTEQNQCLDFYTIGMASDHIKYARFFKVESKDLKLKLTVVPPYDCTNPNVQN